MAWQRHRDIDPGMTDTRFLVALLGALAAAAFAISAGSLTQLAESRHLPFPWLLPFILDGGAVGVAYVAYSAACDRVASRGYAVIVAAFTAVSVSFNVCHVWHDDDIVTSIVHGTPPVVLYVFLEVLLSRLRQQRSPVPRVEADRVPPTVPPTVPPVEHKRATRNTGNTVTVAQQAAAAGVSVRTWHRRRARSQ
jgi:hypothetical protein